MSSYRVSPSALRYGIIMGMLTLGLAVWLTKSTHDIRYWPGDSYNPYIPTAAQYFHLPYPSAMHQFYPPDRTTIQNVRGKEALILGISVMQKITGDTQSLRPNILLNIFVHAINGILVYILLCFLFNATTAFLGSFFYLTSTWPILPLLLGAHQLLVTMNTLLAILCLISRGRLVGRSLGAGFFTGLMIFSSPTALIYLPLKLYRNGRINGMIATKFPTLATNRFWRQEEEVCAYRDLIRKDPFADHSLKNYFLILNGEKMASEILPELKKQP